MKVDRKDHSRPRFTRLNLLLSCPEGHSSQACSLLRDPRPQLGGLWTQGSLSPSSCEMPSTDLWGISHSCRDLVRSENRLLGTSMVSMLQGW